MSFTDSISNLFGKGTTQPTTGTQVSVGGVKVNTDLFQQTSTTINSLVNAQGTVECGSRPTCAGWSDGCKEKQEAYYKCTMAAIEANRAANTINATNAPQVAQSKFKTIAILGAVIVVVLVVVLVITRKSN